MEPVETPQEQPKEPFEGVVIAEKPQKDWTTIILLSLLGLLVLSGAIYGGYWYAKESSKLKVQSPKSETQEQIPTPSPAEQLTPTSSIEEQTKDWKIYTNTEYGYLIKYLPNWKVGIEYGDPEALILHGIEFLGPNSVLVWIEVWRNPSRFSLLEWFDEVPTEHPDYKPGTFRGAPLPQELDSMVAGLPAVQVLEEKTPHSPPYLSIFLGRGDKIYRIGYIADGRLSKDTFDLMLQTFKFTEDETAGWETYKNSYFNYTVKYPANLQFKAIKHGDEVEVGFELKRKGEDIPRITVEAVGAGTSYEEESFDDYVKHAAPSEIQGYESIYSTDKAISDFGVGGHKVRWNCRDLDGSEFISKPFYYYPPSGEFKISLQPVKTVQIHVDAVLKEFDSPETLEFDGIAEEIAESFDFIQK